MADHPEIIGQIVGDYRLRLWLGGGAFGNVYLAEHVRDGQQVAIKILQTRLSQAHDLHTFINEARTIRLRHPHIMPLLDFGIGQDEIPFLVMEYAPRGTLRDRYPKGTRVALPSVIEYTTQMAAALQYAHDQHLVHRDVKPENMLVRSDEMILLSDFGIATTAHSTYSPTGREMAGTVSYMAPEQLAGKPRAATDQYALAVVAYEWIAGHLPFHGTVIEIVTQHATQTPPSLVAQVPGITHEVDAVLLKALAKDYKERFPSVQEFATALQEASSLATVRRSAPIQSAQSRFTEIPPPSSLGVHSSYPLDAPPSQSQLPTMQTTQSTQQKFPMNKYAPPATKKRGWIVLAVLAALLVVGGVGVHYMSALASVASLNTVATVTAKAAATVTSLKATASATANTTATVKAQGTSYNWATPQTNQMMATSQSPALAVFNNRLYMAWKGQFTDQRLYVSNTTDGSSWTPPQSSDALKTNQSPALAVFNNQLNMAWQGTTGDQSLLWSSITDGSNWATPQNNTELKTNQSPALASFNNQLYMAWQGQNTFLNWSSAA